MAYYVVSMSSKKYPQASEVYYCRMERGVTLDKIRESFGDSRYEINDYCPIYRSALGLLFSGLTAKESQIKAIRGINEKVKHIKSQERRGFLKVIKGALS